MVGKRLRLPQWLARTWAKWRQVNLYTVFHTGLQPSVPQLEKFNTRARKILKKTSFQIRKLVKFAQWHTGLQPSVLVPRFISRQRKIRKGDWQLRKWAKFFQWHTGLSPASQANVIQNISLKIRKRKKITRGQRPKLRLYQVFHTGQFTLSPVVHFTSRKRKVITVSRRRRQARFGIVFHTGLSPIITNTTNWLSLGVGTGANRHGAW